jgi:hypothetical protein
MSRKQVNRQILAELFNLVEDPNHSDMRFSQLLSVYGFVRQERAVRFEDVGVCWQNEFYTEPKEILDRVQKRIADLKENA